MLRRALINAALMCVCSAAAFARGNLKELTVPLKYVPQEGVHAASPDLQSGVLSTPVDIRFEDARRQDDPLLIGQGTGGDDKQFPVHADRSVIDYVRESLTDTAKQWGLHVEPSAARVLVVQLTRFSIDESNKALGSVYGTEVKFAFALKDAKGSVLAEGATSGTAHRYGHAHSVDNCNEVLSDALKEAFSNVLSNADLQSAWVSGKRTGTVSAAAAPAETPEQRLRKLEELYNKKLITKEEYEKKRAEILKEL
ncbi:MAG TPA: SHOCT domain-containing protein [Thermoanaerobaculia bacterium]|nr:SHOCT domain-containing protein [Thermoanaerobaculia bacterium]